MKDNFAKVNLEASERYKLMNKKRESDFLDFDMF